MAKLGINTGSTPNDGTGDSLLSGAIKVNSNFDEIYSALGDGSTITNSIDFAVVAGYSTASGIATYATVSGISTYAATAGIATYAATSGISTYAATAGIATEAQSAGGLSGTPDITVGSVTASTLSGAGQAITGIVTYITAGSNIGVDTNFGNVTISSNKPDDYPSKWTQSGLGIHTSANVGLGTDSPLVDFHVNNSSAKFTDGSSLSLDDNNPINLGSSGASDSSIYFNGTDLILQSGSKLTIKGTNNKIIDASNAEGATLYYNGVEKLQVQQDGIDITGRVDISQDISAVGVVSASEFKGTSGVTAAFYGDGSGLTGLTGVGAGVAVIDDGDLLGTAGTLNFVGTGITATFGAGIATITVFENSAYGDSDVDIHLNTSTAQTNEVLSWNGTDYDWVAQSGGGGGGGSYEDADVDNHLNQSSASTGEILSWNGSDYAWVEDSSYADSDVDTHLNRSTASTGEILSWNGSDYDWIAGQDGSPVITWTLTANGASDYIFSGYGFPTSQNDPTLYLVRGQTYRFVNNVGTFGGTHPFRIQSNGATAGGGTQYNNGVTNNDAGNGDTLTFTVPMDAPDTLYYQCTSHQAMFGTINVLSASGGGSSYANSDVDTHLNVSGASSGDILSWNGSDYAWVADQTGITTAIINSDAINSGTLTVSGVSTFSGNIEIAGSSNLFVGPSNSRVEISHNTSNGNMTSTVGYMYIRGESGFRVQKEGGGFDDIIKADADGAVELYYDDVKKFETLGVGATVTGTMYATGFSGDGSALTGITASSPSRATTNAATSSIAQAASADITIPTPGKSFALLKIEIDAPAWVVLYTDTSSRTSDASRTEGTDPTPGSGVLAEVSTTSSGASTFKMTPGLIGWNDDGTPASQIYAKVVNKRATTGSNTITVTLTSLKLED